ncbi:VWA domain-containing protein [Roseibacterium sp. SDUM158016]|jgi:Ca-activated chloride channel family protein|uniref:vWA domain-containing protein n=1 Tax=Roseicyclus sediminis TaxID=2980997 RepID=UPI0021D3935D|nr:VWA domain-containing protein [Roseibacterium sp. SDUM158016]MCU4653299.1 VWA domain-containing protein [Roseibacterium sp. SDUM158016]
MISFLWPFAALLLPLPILARRFLPPRPEGAAGAIRVPFFGALAGGGTAAARGRRLPAILAWVIWLLLIAALMRPVLVGEPAPLPVEGRDIMMAVDLSGSMAREDFLAGGRPATRLDVVKAAARDFIGRRAGDRIGLVLFSDRAYVQAPLTFDRAAVSGFLDEAQVGLTGTETAIGDAIAVSLQRLRDRPQGDRVLVLLTDGASNAGVLDPVRAAELAAELNVRVYTIGVGATRMVAQTALGRQVVNPSADLDEATLTRIADMTGGRFFRATDAEGLADVYRAIDRIEPVASDPQVVRPEVSMLHWPLGLALILALAAGLARLPLALPGERLRKTEARP